MRSPDFREPARGCIGGVHAGLDCKIVVLQQVQDDGSGGFACDAPSAVLGSDVPADLRRIAPQTAEMDRPERHPFEIADQQRAAVADDRTREPGHVLDIRGIPVVALREQPVEGGVVPQPHDVGLVLKHGQAQDEVVGPERIRKRV